jgi:hypothetical protein
MEEKFEELNPFLAFPNFSISVFRHLNPTDVVAGATH